MNKSDIKNLNDKGYCIIYNVLNQNEILKAKQMFHNWYGSIPNLDKYHKKYNPHGILKFHQVGHQEFAWYIRTLPQVINIFAQIWNTNKDNLVCSFDGCCYIKKGTKTNTACWTHSDQAPKNKDLRCFQSFVSLTDNYENTLIIYEETHKIHSTYFKSRGLDNNPDNWQLIEYDFLNTIKEKKKILKIPAGSMVIWDSRTFHQNIVSNSDEERLVQYVCMKPKNHPENSALENKKRKIYFDNLRTTTHWPFPISVNNLFPDFINDSYLIDYDSLPKPNLKPYMNGINNLI